MDVKDTVHKSSLMLHLVDLVVERFPESTDLYSELPHVHRVAKVSGREGGREGGEERGGEGRGGRKERRERGKEG